MKSVEDRIIDMVESLIEVLRDDIPEVGGAAMTHLLAFHTNDSRELWLEKMGAVWDLHHNEKE